MDEQKLQNNHHFEVGFRNFQNIVAKIDDKKTYQKALRQANKKYQIKNFKVLNMTPVKARKFYPQIIEKYRQDLALQQSWLQNERRLFIWTILCYVFIEKKSIKELTNEEYSMISSIFNNKKQDFLKFQIHAILKKSKKQSKWTLQEDNYLLEVLSSQKFQEQQIQWNEVSKHFFYLSGQRFYRSSKQCRERWMNHLDPNKIKGSWTTSQDFILLKYVKQNGKRWSLIVKQLQGCKTQHMVKNRFNSLVNKKGKQIKTKNQGKILTALLNQIKSSDTKDIEDEFKTLSKDGKSNQSNKSDQIKSQKNQGILSIFESENSFDNEKKFKFIVKRAGSLSISERGDFLPELTNPILQEMDSEQERSRQKFFISTPLSQRGGQIKSPYLMASPILIGNGGNFTPSMFFLQQNAKVSNNIYGSDFGMSYSSNFDKFVPQ